jgi:hypothetical protein
MAFHEITKDEALAALRDQVFTTDDGRRIIHVMGAITGADWSLEEAEQAVQSARTVGWTDNFLRHELAVVEADSRVWSFGVQRTPEGSAHG